MPVRIRYVVTWLILALISGLCVHAQIRPEVTPKPKKPPATKKPVAQQPSKEPEKAPEAKPAQIVINTSPNADVYLDDQFAGRASPEGRLVVGNSTAGVHALRVSLTGKRNYEQKVTVVGGETTRVEALLADLPAQIVVETSPGAEAYLDDQFAGRASPEGRLVIANPKAGVQTLRVSLAGKRDYLQQVTVVAGQTAKVEARLSDLHGKVVVRSSAGAEVFVDNSSRGITDASGQLTIAEVAAGAHELRITAPGKRDRRQNITVAAGEETKVEVTLAELGPSPGALKENPKDGLKYVWISPGSFQMGCSADDSKCESDEKSVHQVTLSKGFWLGQTEVTVDAYKRFANGTGRGMPPAPSFNSGWSNGQMPVVNVTWADAQAYCTWAGGRLPREAEWEYAARGGSSEARYGPLDEIAWYNKNSGSATHQVGEKRANAFGLFDTLGNVWEWVSDWYDAGTYANSLAVDPSGPPSGTGRVIRGGSWLNNPRVVRVSDRDRSNPGVSYNYVVGFRCVREVVSP